MSTAPVFSRSLFKSQTVEWATPEWLYLELDREFKFNFDPCPLGGSQDGLSPLFAEWAGKRVFCNPPYGDVSAWLKRGLEAELAVYLLPARTDTRWFHDQILPHASEIRFIRGRLKFRAKNPSWKPGGGGAPFPSMVVVFGSRPPKNGTVSEPTSTPEAKA